MLSFVLVTLAQKATDGVLQRLHPPLKDACLLLDMHPALQTPVPPYHKSHTCLHALGHHSTSAGQFCYLNVSQSSP